MFDILENERVNLLSANTVNGVTPYVRFRIKGISGFYYYDSLDDRVMKLVPNKWAITYKESIETDIRIEDIRDKIVYQNTDEI